ncbi:MAG: FadR/GntR family transcriptional regulator [Pseudoflavonifractor sp.]|nr:FadR/GntR family transcriptional regulator [Pseudoflavonifractor sp.]
MESKSKNLKIKRETLNEKVEQKLRQMLTDGVWGPGERLPTESELAEMFGVSRLTVRMALQKLSTGGLVSIRAGEGTYAKKFSLRSYLDAASDLYVTPEMLDDVRDFRKLLEVECARLACERATEEDIHAMQQACDNYLEIIQNGQPLDEVQLQRRVKADLDFHDALCRASHNNMYILSFNAAQGAVAKHLENIIPSRIKAAPELDYVPDGRTLHQYILDAIKRGDAETCCRAYVFHINHRMGTEEYKERIQSL